jgi:chlorinating enzyme
MATLELTPARTYEPYPVSVEEYRRFRDDGFLVVKGLVPLEDVQEMNQYMDDLLEGRITVDGALAMRGIGEKMTNPRDWLRVHMLHLKSEIHERFLLHPRTLDVLAALIGPDVLALQSMLFFKQPGQEGQGYHQDSYYIPSFPDTLCGAWLALTEATIENGCMWMTVGSQHEPIYPDVGGTGSKINPTLDDLGTIQHASNTDLELNGLSRVMRKYEGRAVPVEAEPGDMVFFGGHIIHWSLTNHGLTPRRSYVGHYCNARSVVPWNHGQPWEGEFGNYLHILARGHTHLPYAQPKFGTPCAANAPRPVKDPSQPVSMMAMANGDMGEMPHGNEADHNDD